MDTTGIFNQNLYHHWVADNVRFGDLDPLGHVNNNAIGQYFEHARAILFMDITPGWPKRSELFVLARSAIDFHRELHLPAAIKVGSRVLKLGRTSMTLGNALFRGNDGIAYNESVSVLIDAATRQPVALPDDLRQCLQKYV